MAAALPDRAVPATPLAGRLAAAATAGITILSLLWASDLNRTIGLGAIFTEQMAAVALGLAIAVVFVLFRARKAAPKWPLPPIDAALAIAGFAACAYLAWRYPVFNNRGFYMPTETLIVAGFVFLLVLEAMRRSIGWSLIVILLVFGAYALVAHLAPGKLQGKFVPLDDLLRYAVLDGGAMLGSSLLIAVEVVVPFILFGALLHATGGSEFFTDISAAALGRYRGGAAKISVMGSCLFGTVSGSAVANVAAVGVVTIPLMKRAGYPPMSAAAIEAVGSTGGQLMPPVMGAAAFMMAEFLNVSYGTVVVAALVPSFLYYATIFIYADLEAAKRGVKRMAEDDIPRARTVLARGWHFVLSFAVLLGLILATGLRAEKAALYACGALLLFAAFLRYGGKRLKPRDVLTALVETGRSSVEIVIICAVAGMIIGVLQRSTLDFALTLILVDFGKASLLLLLVSTAVVAMVLGLGLPTTAVYLMLATLAAKPLTELGVLPIAAHMFVFYFGMLSMVTPPVAMAAFTAANIAGTGPMMTGWVATLYAWPSYIVPFLFVLSPTLLLRGDPLSVALDVTTALLGIWATTAAIVGYLFRALSGAQRWALGLAGLALMIPASLFAGAYVVTLIGAVAAALVVVWHRAAGKTAAA